MVPRWAKSAAILLALGADEIVLGDFGELGPLDALFPDPDHGGYASALDETHALYRLHSFALEAFSLTMDVLGESLQMKSADLIPFATNFALGMTRPLLDDLDTVHYTYYSRVLRKTEEYASRLLSCHHDRDKANGIAFHLVEKYFDHGFVIDVEEAKGFGLETIRGPSQKVARILDELATMLDGVFIFGRVKKTS